jgi:hypothetical protein
MGKPRGNSWGRSDGGEGEVGWKAKVMSLLRFVKEIP